MVNLRYYVNLLRHRRRRNCNSLSSDEDIINKIQSDFIQSISDHNFTQFVYAPIPNLRIEYNEEYDFFRFLFKRIDTPKQRIYTITCQESGEIIFYIIRKFSFFKMKENYEIYLNYTPLKCNFIIKDLTKIIEHYAGHGFNKNPNNGILIGNFYSNIRNGELILENAKLLRKHTKTNIRYSAKHDLYTSQKNLTWKEWINYQSSGILKTTVQTNIIDLSHPIKKIDEDISEIYILNNEKPIWNEHMMTYVLNFKGRAKVASTKNTIFLNKDNQRIALFGKLRNNEYALDIANPLSLIQAICLALTCLGKN